MPPAVICRAGRAAARCEQRDPRPRAPDLELDVDLRRARASSGTSPTLHSRQCPTRDPVPVPELRVANLRLFIIIYGAHKRKTGATPRPPSLANHTHRATAYTYSRRDSRTLCAPLSLARTPRRCPTGTAMQATRAHRSEHTKTRHSTHRETRRAAHSRRGRDARQPLSQHCPPLCPIPSPCASVHHSDRSCPLSSSAGEEQRACGAGARRLRWRGCPPSARVVQLTTTRPRPSASATIEREIAYTGVSNFFVCFCSRGCCWCFGVDRWV
jgi:hypothetical protein